MLVSGYAIYTFTDSYGSAIPVAILWGAIIFNLNRYIVSSMRKAGNERNELIMALPRIVLAVLISVVISRPLELKIFEKEIGAELTLINSELKEARVNQLRTKANMAILLLQKENTSLDSLTFQKEELRNELRSIARQEADGTGGSKKRNACSFIKSKKPMPIMQRRNLQSYNIVTPK